MKIVRIVILITTCLLVSCASTFGNLTSIQRFEPEKVKNDDAVVILSAGTPKSCLGTEITLEIFTQNHNKVRSYGYSASSHQLKSDYETHHGFLHAFTLKPGDYYLYPQNTIYMTEAPKANFEILPNEIVYLGEYFVW